MTLQLTEPGTALTQARVQPGSGTGRKGGNGQVVFQDGVSAPGSSREEGSTLGPRFPGKGRQQSTTEQQFHQQ